MKHLTIIAAALSICFISCKNGNKKDNVETQATTDTVKTTATNTIAETPTDFTPDKTFTFNKADIHESLKVQQLGKNKIAYEVYMENGNCAVFTHQGVANLKEGDAETDSDENNNSFLVDEYVDATAGACGITIRIGADKGYTNRAKFSVYDCSKVCKTKPESEALLSAK